VVDCSPSNARDFCPTADELAPQYLALLPRGRAWGEGGPGREPGGILYGWIYALAIVMAAAHATLCTLKLEFFCATATATLDLWQEDYGLPDDCDPYADVCAKVAATGGVTCAYYEEVAASIGWSITCGTSCAIDCGLIEAGMVGGPVAGPGTLMFVVYLAGSSAFSGSTQVMGPVAGFLEAGMAPACGPDITALDCVMQRIAPAHADIVYSLV
jgi:uncharacterized protein YmfQ (DUF2313 family)